MPKTSLHISGALCEGQRNSGKGKGNKAEEKPEVEVGKNEKRLVLCLEGQTKLLAEHQQATLQPCTEARISSVGSPHW